jgi:hypothetical protein
MQKPMAATVGFRNHAGCSSGLDVGFDLATTLRMVNGITSCMSS